MPAIFRCGGSTCPFPPVTQKNSATAKITRHSRESIRWFCPDPAAVHVGKSVVYDKNGLVSETDTLGKGMDRLTIATTYAGGGQSVAKQEATMESNGGAAKPLPMTDTEKILKEWKIR